LQQQLALTNFFRYEKKDRFPYTVIVWTHPLTRQMYFEITVEVLMSMVKDDCLPSISEDGTNVNIDLTSRMAQRFCFHPGCWTNMRRTSSSLSGMESTLVKLIQSTNSMSKQAAQIHDSTLKDIDIHPMKIGLPFPCNMKGFLDPLSSKPVKYGIVLGKF
jgi:hypothetical protein